MKPTERTLKLFREDGWTCDMIERWTPNPKHPAGGFRKDYLGFGDILAFRSSEVAIIQSCGSNYSEHVKTILSIPEAFEWARWNKLFLIGWRKVKYKRGGKLKVWKPRIANFHVIDDVLVHIERKKKGGGGMMWFLRYGNNDCYSVNRGHNGKKQQNSPRINGGWFNVSQSFQSTLIFRT